MTDTVPVDDSRYTAADADGLAERLSTPDSPVNAHDVRGAMRLAGLATVTVAEVEAAIARWRTEPA